MSWENRIDESKEEPGDEQAKESITGHARTSVKEFWRKQSLCLGNAIGPSYAVVGLSCLAERVRRRCGSRFRLTTARKVSRKSSCRRDRAETSRQRAETKAAGTHGWLQPRLMSCESQPQSWDPAPTDKGSLPWQQGREPLSVFAARTLKAVVSSGSIVGTVVSPSPSSCLLACLSSLVRSVGLWEFAAWVRHVDPTGSASPAEDIVEAVLLTRVCKM